MHSIERYLLGNSKIHIEKEVVEQFKAGSELAFEIVFHRTKGQLKGFLKQVLPIDEDVESILQEIYLKLWTNRKTIKVEKSFETYLFAIARNMVVDTMRKRLSKQKYLESLFQQLKEGQKNDQDTLDKVEYSELEKAIFDLIEKLPEKRQAIFKLNRIEGMTYKQIADKLNVSENTVDTQMRKALSFLRSEMKHYLGVILWIYLNH